MCNSKNNHGDVKTTIIAVFAVIILLVVGVIGAYYYMINSKIYKKIIVEAGSEVTADLFCKQKGDTAEILTDMDEINTHQTGDFDIKLKYHGYTLKSELVVADTIAPEGEVTEGKVILGKDDSDISASDLVTSSSDNTVAIASFDKDYTFDTPGDVAVTVVLTDLGGNVTELPTTVKVVDDTKAPVFKGVKDIEIHLGESISYKKGVSVSDDTDENVDFTVDNSYVDANTVGEYEATYEATDEAGNVAKKTIKVTVLEPEAGVYNEEIISYYVKQVLDEIITDDMSDAEKIRAVYKWIRANIGYIEHGDHTDWMAAAYEGLTTHRGDCYTFYGTATAFMEELGFENMMVEKSDTSHSRHYWNLVNIGTGWYHYDTTPRASGGDFFMLTDAELEAYSSAHGNTHVFDHSAYPERATEEFELKLN